MGYPSRTAVQWSQTDRPVDDLITELLARVARDTNPVLRWWVSEATRPADTEDVLARRGFVQVETVEVVALELTDADSLTGHRMTEEPAGAELDEIQRGLATGHWRVLRMAAVGSRRPSVGRLA